MNIDPLIFAMWTRELESRDMRRRMVAGQEICRMTGWTDVVAAAETPPPEWPACDVMLAGGGQDEAGQFVTARVRTRLGGVLWEDVRIAVGRHGMLGSPLEALERGKAELVRRVKGMGI